MHINVYHITLEMGLTVMIWPGCYSFVLSSLFFLTHNHCYVIRLSLGEVNVSYS